MSVVEPSSSGVRGSTTSKPRRHGWGADFFKPKSTTVQRQPIRGMEAQLVDLVFESSSPKQLMDWLTVSLECATAAGSLSAVKRLLAAGVKTVALPERSRRAPLLHLASESGNVGVVEELLKAGVDVREKDSSRGRRTALHCAAAAGSDAAVRALTRAGANINLLDGKGWSPLHHACMNGHRDVVVFLLLSGARAQRRTRTDMHPPLHLAATNNHPGVIEDLLYFGKVSVGRWDAQNRRALYVAAKHCRVEACVALLRGGATIGLDGWSDMNCLDIAASRGHTGQLLRVLTMAEETGARERGCSWALYHAVKAEECDTIDDLVALGADVDYRRLDRTNLHIAVMYGLFMSAEALLQAGANVEARFLGSTPLHMACERNFVDVVQLLLFWGADESATDSHGKVPSETVGKVQPLVDEELLPPEEIASIRLSEDRIRTMLETAPGDRSWRRRGWLVLCRERWLARIGAGKKRSTAPLGFVPDRAMTTKKRRRKRASSALVVKPRDFSLGKGKAHGRKKGGGRRMLEVTAPAGVLRLGACSVLSDGGAGQAAGVARVDGRPSFVAAVEELLLLREGSIFREVVAFL